MNFKCQVGDKHNINFGTTDNKRKGKFWVREAHILKKKWNSIVNILLSTIPAKTCMFKIGMFII